MKAEDSLFVNEIRETTRLGIPIVLGQLAFISFGVIDTIMAGNLSALDLAAIAVGRSLYMPLFIIVMGILLAVSPMVAQDYGAGRLKNLAPTFWQGLLLSQLFVLPCFLLVRNTDAFMQFMEIDPEIVPISLGYLQALSWSLPAAFAFQILRFFNEGVSLTKPNMYFAFLGIPINIAANYCLMWGKLGFPKLGAIGAGWATTIIWYTISISLFLYIRFSRRYAEFNLFDRIRGLGSNFIREILKIGVPNGVSFGMEVSMFALVALLVGGIGVVETASHQIAISIASTTFMIPLGLSLATTSRVGFHIGRQALDASRLAGQVGLVMSAATMIVTALIMFIIPEKIVGIYTNESEVIALASTLLFSAAIFQLSDGIQVSAAGALRGLKDTRIPMFVNAFAYWVAGIPLGYYLGITKGMGAAGLWIGLIGGLTVAAFAHSARFFYLSSKEQIVRFAD